MLEAKTSPRLTSGESDPSVKPPKKVERAKNSIPNCMKKLETAKRV